MSLTDLKPASSRVMVIALDGATWDLARPWMNAGLMPNLARVVTEGVSAEMHAELPPSSVPNWPAFMTGKNAGKHGCAWWLQRDEDGWLDSLPINAQNVIDDTIWSYLSTHGKRVIVQNVPVTYPVESVNGFMISGLLTPQKAEDFIFPPAFKQELDHEVGNYKIYPQGGFGHGHEQEFLNALIENVRQHTQAAEFLLRTQDWDFFILVIGPTDEVSHKYWHYMDPNHPQYKPKDAARFRESIQKVYMASDEAIGRLSRFLGESDTLILMSDHGFGPLERFFHVNNWLLKNDYLQLKKTGATPLKKLLYQAGFTPRNVFPLGKQLLASMRGMKALRQRLDPGRQGSHSPLRKIFLSNDDIDWSHSQVIATGFLCAQLFINLQGRDPAGIVPVEDYEPLREKLITQLSRVINPFTGQLHFSQIFRREDLYTGPFLETLPDLLCLPADLRTADSGMGFRSNKLFDTDESLSGTHRKEGIFAIRGNTIRKGVEIPPIRIYDLAPTILYQLGLPVPDDMDGQVIEAAVEAHEISARPVQFAPACSSRPLGWNGHQEEGDESVKERLRDLGYLS